MFGEANIYLRTLLTSISEGTVRFIYRPVLPSAIDFPLATKHEVDLVKQLVMGENMFSCRESNPNMPIIQPAVYSVN
jgi:hypothetical protein